MRHTLAILSLLLLSVLPLVGESQGTLSGTLKSVWLRKYPMLIYLESVAGEFKPPQTKPTIDQKNKMFVPHLLPVLEGTIVQYLNHDDTKHNIYFVQPDNQKVNLGTGMANWSKDHTMDQIGVYAHRCNIHDEMSAYVVVMDNPFYALIDRKAGRDPAEFKLEGVPEGDYKLHVWCEKFYNQKNHKFNRAWDVSIKAGEETKIEVKP